MRWRLAAALVLLGSQGLAAQNLPVLRPEHVQIISQEISGDAAYEHIRFHTQFHKPRGGTNGLWEVARYFEQRAREAGLVDVRLIRQDASNPPWNARFADLWITGTTPERLASTLQTPLHLADHSRRADVTAELVDVRAGTTEADYAGKEVAGKVVLAHGAVGTVMNEATRRGAAGVVWFPDPSVDRNLSYPDQVNWVTLPVQTAAGAPGTFAFILSLRQGVALRNRVAQAREPVRVRALVDADFTSTEGERPWQVMVEGYIRGTEPGLAQDVMLTAHLQEEKFSANDDGSGIASILEIARALNRLIDEGKLPRPRRNLRFWWLTEISSQRQYFADNPDAHRRMWVNVNQDMVGANQAQDVMRVQNVTRLPASRFHFLNDVTEAVVDYMVASNNYELAQAQNGIPLYPRPHFAHLGTRHRFNAKMIFFHANTDHVPFNEAPIGVPGVTFTNMPDFYIHTSDDDLWNIDRTQLGRNAAAVAMIAYAMASADDRSAPALAAETVSRGMQRVARNLGLGLSWVATAEESGRAAAYHDAVEQVRYAARRERRAIGSLGGISPAAQRMVPAWLAELDRQEEQAIRDLGLQYRSVTGRAAPAAAPRSEAEARLAAMRPALVAGPREFLNRRGQLSNVPGLHGLMAFEVLNFVDGRRTGLEIFREVAAQAREAGDFYYGVVRPEAVIQYLEGAERVGVVRLR
ncbi:MAG TPA: M28 family peptidase [Longimicrobiaceae bacterium]|nr:M28 family peptidase [Longimicrobiaceae bacterium]